MRTTLSVLLGLALLVGCGDDGSSVDSGGLPDVGPGDSAAADSARPADGATRDGARADGGTPPPSAPPGPLPWEDCEGGGRTLGATPEDYRSLLDGLMPGDTLRLGPGTYARGLPVSVSGTAASCIVIEGTPGAARPLFTGSDSFNIIALRGASWLKVRGFDIDGMGLGGFGVASQNPDEPVHHIVIEDLEMRGLAGNRQITGISTKTPAWDWVIRGNRILEAGTGLYLGNSDGRQPFIGGLIEYNLVVDTLGYNMQIKHQIAEGRGDLGTAGMPDEAATVIRYNVFAKVNRGETGGGARPNVLLGHFPRRGSGQGDRYLIYGNFFYDNPTERLLQGEGNLAIYDNVFVNPHGDAVRIQPHNDVPKEIDVVHNTIVATGLGVGVSGGAPGFTQVVRWNVVFAGEAIRADTEHGNITGALGEASAILRNPSGTVGVDLNVRPSSPDAVRVEEIDLSLLADYPEGSLDFDRFARPGDAAGAYVPGHDGWRLAVEARPR